VEDERNNRMVGVDWRFTTADARIRLRRLYPQLECVDPLGHLDRVACIEAAVSKHVGLFLGGTSTAAWR